MMAMTMNGYGSPAQAQLNAAAQTRSDPMAAFEMQLQQRMM